MTNQAPSVLLSTPCFGSQVNVAYMDSVLRLQIACAAQGVNFGFNWLGGEALITRARAELVSQFLNHPRRPSHLLFVDADIVFRPEQVFRLLQFNADVTAAAYPIKGIDWKRATKAALNGRDAEAASLDYVAAWASDPIFSRNGFAKVKYAGTGFLLIRREVIERLCQAHPELKYRTVHGVGTEADVPNRYALFECMIDPSTGEYLPEDFAFCRRWTDLGGEIWLDLDSQLTHIGQHYYNGRLKDALTRHQ